MLVLWEGSLLGVGFGTGGGVRFRAFRASPVHFSVSEPLIEISDVYLRLPALDANLHPEVLLEVRRPCRRAHTLVSYYDFLVV